MRIGICDDREQDRNLLLDLVGTYYRERGVDAELVEFESGEELLSRWKDGWLTYLFLDVYMGGISGMDVARKIRETDRTCAIIFTTTSPDHAIDSYEVQAADYLLKPFGKQEVEETLRWCDETIGQPPRDLEVISKRERRTITRRKIRYVEVYRQVSVIHTTQEEIPTNERLSRLEEEIADADFLRCHRSYLVNMHYILRPEGRDFLLLDHTRIPIAVKHAAKIKQTFFEWSFKQTWEME